jgi:PAS domain-containing protein
MHHDRAMPADFTLAIRVGHGATYDQSSLLLARATFQGTLELLTAAWGHVLGYSSEEFEGRTLRQLMRSNRSAAAAAVAAILDERDTGPIDLTLRLRDGTRERLRFYRRFDEYTRGVFILADDAYRASGTLK